MTPDDVILAFFPCTRFEQQVLLWFRGENYGQKGWSDIQKLEKDIELHEELNLNYSLITKLAIVILRKGLKMVFENPYSDQHYLTKYWCIKPKVIDKDRAKDGDYYKKPTQYWFFGCEPKENIVFEPIEYIPTKTIVNEHNKAARSEIHPQYAERFIKKYIIDYQTDFEKVLKGE